MCKYKERDMEDDKNKKDEKAKPIVTVLCITYNHASYIKDCLEGIVRQKTNFPFRAYIHDDASTDGTAEIILEYAQQYPEIIVPLLEEENQFSKGVQPSTNMMDQIIWGKYIAVCEGDDYWTDDTKLQVQFDFMEQNSDYSLCLHNAIINDLEHEIDYLSEPDSGNRLKTCEEIIIEGAGKLNPTSSFFFASAAEYPLIEHGCSFGDHFELIKLASRGKVHWISKPMSVYRRGSKNSWTESFKRKNFAAKKTHTSQYIKGLNTYDVATKGVFSEAFQARKELLINNLEHEKKLLEISEAKSIKDILSINATIKDLLKVSVQDFLPKKIEIKLKRLNQIHKKRHDHTLVALLNRSYTLKEFPVRKD